MSESSTSPFQPSRWLPALLAVAVFMQMLSATILNTALPKMAIDLNESPLSMQSTIIAYVLTLALLMPLSGYLSDSYGTKKVFAASMLIFIVGSLLCAVAPSLNMLVVARVIQGMGGAMLMPLPRLVIMRAYPKTQILSIMNFVITPALLGPVMGPLVGGYLVDYASWHWIFFINIPIGLLGIWMTLKIMPDFYSPDGQRPHFDVLGFLLFGGAAAGLSFAVEMLPNPNARLFSLLTGALAMISLWLYWQHAKRDRQALYPIHLGQIRTFRLGMIGNLLSRLGMAAVPFLLPLLLQVAFGRSASIAGWTLAPIAIAAMLTKPLIKPLVGQFGYRNVLIWNTRLIGLIIISLSLLTPTTPLWLMIPILFLLGMGNSLQYSSMNSLTIADLRSNQASSGNSLMAVNQQLAIGFGTALGALLLNWFSDGSHEQTVLHDAFRHTFWIIGATTFASSWVFVRLHPQDGDNLVKRKG